MSTSFQQHLQAPLSQAFITLGEDPALGEWLQLVHPEQLRILIQQGADAALEAHPDASTTLQSRVRRDLAQIEEQLISIEPLHKEVRYFIEMDVLDPQSRLSDPRSHTVQRPVIGPTIAATGLMVGGLIGAAIGPTWALMAGSGLGGGIGGWIGSRSTHRAPAEAKIKAAISALEEAVEHCRSALDGASPRN